MHTIDYRLQNCRNQRALEKKKADVLIVLLSAHAMKNASADNSAAESEGAIAQLLRSAHAAEDLKKAGNSISMYQPESMACRRLVLAVTDTEGDSLRSLLTSALAHKPATLSVCLPEAEADDDHRANLMRRIMREVFDATYRFQTTKPTTKPSSLKKLVLLAAADNSLKRSFAQEKAALEGVAFSREWANRPANFATPSMLAKAAQELAKQHPNISCRVRGPKEVSRLKMGAFMSVAAGSDEPLRFIEIDYTGGNAKSKPIVLVGKGVTFDSGGISLKPGAGMDEMKYDMCGAASVLGVFRALTVLQPEINVKGLIPACENMPGGRATKPGDVVTAMNGTTIEVLNTDAEGRLILCDALCYAARCKPRAVIDIATLTGACVISLGRVRSGMFSDNDSLAEALHSAGEAADDLCWRLPLDKAYAKQLKSKYADLANIGGREAGSVTAACFLQHFTDYPWAHLDIAGTAWKTGSAKGATGRPVPLLLEYLVRQSQTP